MCCWNFAVEKVTILETETVEVVLEVAVAIQILKGAEVVVKLEAIKVVGVNCE